MRRLVTFCITHGIALAIGFALGIYLLPILTAPPSPDAAMLEEKSQNALYTAELTRDLRGSDFLHWGEGTISLSATEVVHMGALAPGPDYIAYLTPAFVEHEDEFDPIKADALVSLSQPQNTVEACHDTRRDRQTALPPVRRHCLAERGQ